jgi:hypothetical protein
LGARLATNTNTPFFTCPPLSKDVLAHISVSTTPAMISTRQLHSSPKVTGISMAKVGKLYRPSTVERLYILWSPINRQSAMVTVRGGHKRTSRFARAYAHTDAADTCSNMCVPLLL